MTPLYKIKCLENDIDHLENIIEGLKEEREELIEIVKDQKVKIDTLSHILNQYQMERLK